MADRPCDHISSVKDIKQPARRECEECVISDHPGFICGPASSAGRACSDNSLNRHATKHAKESGHPVIASAELGERWLYCYPDDAFAEY